MAGILKSLLGSGINEEKLSAELRSILSSIQKEREDFENLVTKAARSGEHLEYITSVASRLKAVENQMDAVEKLVPQIAAVQDSAEGLEKGQRRAEKQLVNAAADAERIQQRLEELADKLEQALTVRDDIQSILELERPFKALRSEADGLEGQLHYLSDGFNRIREQHDDITGAQQRAASRLEAFDNEYQRLAGGVDSTEKRVSVLEQALENLAKIAPGVRDTKHQIATLKSLTDQVTQKTAALEGQREAIERATNQATNLNSILRQFDAAVEKQRENAKTLSEYGVRAEELTALHRTVLERSEEITEHQQQIDSQAQDTRVELAALRDEAQKTVERFKMENQGVESVSQRVADLRSMLTTIEERFGALEESSEGITDIRAKTDNLSSQLTSIVSEVSQLNEQAEKIRMVRASAARLDQVVLDITQRVGRIEAAQPAVEAALNDVSELSRNREVVTDALEQAQAAHGELTRMREEQAEAKSWLTSVERSVGTLRDQVKELSSLKPTVEFVRKEAEEAIESTKAIESRREVVDEMYKRLGELTSTAARVDERSQGLLSRMNAAESRFEKLSQQSEEAERLSTVISAVGTAVQDAEQRIEGVGASVETLEQRSQNLEALSQRVRRLGHELDQRQGSLEKASEHLERASTLRQEAAATAQQLEEQLQSLTSILTSAENRAGRMTALSENLEDRSNSLCFVEKRMVQFEERLAKWELAEAEVARALDHVAGRQATIDTLQVDIRSMFKMTERTVEDVRAITEAQPEIGQTRAQVEQLLGRFQELDERGDKLEIRNRQIDQAEERLARANALLIELESSIEMLQGQKTIVDHVVEKAGSLAFHTRQAEGLIQILREERELIGPRMRAAAAPKEQEDQPPSQEGMAKAG